MFPPIIPLYEEESDAKEDGIVFYRCLGILAGDGVGRDCTRQDQGIPVSSDLVVKKCADCHKNNGGLVSRISYLRQVPEAWEETLWRHKRIHGLSITKEEKEALLLYFSDKQGLAPAEVVGYAYTLEKRDTKEKVDSQVIVDICVRCHRATAEKTALQRRSPEDWPKLANMHSGVLPMWPYQLQDVLDWDETLAACVKELQKRFPLETPEWKQWSASRPKAGEGKWAVAGYQAGKGAYGGEINLKKTGDAFYTYAGTVEFENGRSCRSRGRRPSMAATRGGRPVPWPESRSVKSSTSRWMVRPSGGSGLTTRTSSFAVLKPAPSPGAARGSSP